MRAFLLVGFAAGAFSWLAPFGVALDQGTLSVSPKSTDAKKTYGPIAGSNPALTHSPSDCKTAAYCDTIALKIDTATFKSNDAWQVSFALEWANDAAVTLELYIYDPQGTRLAADNHGTSPEKTSIDRPQSGTYTIVVNNFAGPDTGYTLSVALDYLGKLKAIPKFVEPTPRPLFTPLPPLSTPQVARPSQPLTASATLAPVITPGPNGTPASFGLSTVQAGAAIKGGTPAWVVLVSGIAGAGMLGGAAFLLFRRIRV